MIELDPNDETAIVITVPDTMDPEATQVLVRIPGHIPAANIAVDFRPDAKSVWTPSDFFPRSVEVRHQ